MSCGFARPLSWCAWLLCEWCPAPRCGFCGGAPQPACTLQTSFATCATRHVPPNAQTPRSGMWRLCCACPLCELNGVLWRALPRTSPWLSTAQSLLTTCSLLPSQALPLPRPQFKRLLETRTAAHLLALWTPTGRSGRVAAAYGALFHPCAGGALHALPCLVITGCGRVVALLLLLSFS
jgi:hypothetical protein